MLAQLSTLIYDFGYQIDIGNSMQAYLFQKVISNTIESIIVSE